MNSDFRERLADLWRSRVRFLVVGGYAVMHHTEPRFTKNLDLWIEPHPEIAERLREALLRFGAWLEHMKVADFCEEGVMIQIGIPPVRVDFLTSVSGLEFSGCWDRREIVTLGATEVPMLGLADLIIGGWAVGRSYAICLGLSWSRKWVSAIPRDSSQYLRFWAVRCQRSAATGSRARQERNTSSTIAARRSLASSGSETVQSSVDSG
jgi:hypothetical protein